MKKTILISLTSLFTFTAATYAQDYKKVFHSEFMKQCMQGLDPESGIAKEDFKSYCTCASETILETLSEDEIIELGENIELNEGLLMEIIDPCLQDLQAKYE